jgi:diacylglycerol kinase family enzyme
MENICIIVNPHSQNGLTNRKLTQYIKRLADEGLVFDTYYSTSKKHFKVLFREIVDDYEIFIAIGGDGLIHSLIQLLAERKNKRLAIVPAGNGNMLASQHNIFSIEDTISSIKNGRVEKVDLIKIEYLTSTGERKTVYSHCIIGIGYIADVVKYATNIFKKLGPKWCYPFAGALATLRIDSFDIEFGVDSNSKYVPNANAVILLNQGRIGPFNITKNVIDTDGYIDYVMFHDGTSPEAVLCFLDGFFGKYIFNKHRVAGKAKKVEVKLFSEKDFMVDGEMYEKVLYFSAEIVPKALMLLSNTSNISKTGGES